MMNEKINRLDEERKIFIKVKDGFKSELKDFEVLTCSNICCFSSFIISRVFASLSNFPLISFCFSVTREKDTWFARVSFSIFTSFSWRAFSFSETIFEILLSSSKLLIFFSIGRNSGQKNTWLYTYIVTASLGRLIPVSLPNDYSCPPWPCHFSYSFPIISYIN